MRRLRCVNPGRHLYRPSTPRAATLGTDHLRAHLSVPAAPLRGVAPSTAATLARHATAGDYPLASRVGTTAGEAQGRAYDPDLAYAFGLERIAAGVQALRRRTRHT